MSKRFVLTAADGHVAVLQLVELLDESEIARGLKLAKALRDFAAVSFEPVSVAPVDQAQVPTDRSYRDAWSFDGAAFGYDMQKARALHRDKIRTARVPLLAALDVEVSKALAKGDSAAAAIEIDRQKLRDAPADARIDAAKTIDELKAAWPL